MAALLKVEGDIQRVDIRIVCVVDQYAVVDALLYVQAHGDGLQLGELLSVVHTGRLQVKHDCQAVDDILDRRIVGERNDIFLGQSEQCTADDCFRLFLFDRFNVKRCVRIRPAPGNRFV